MNFRFLIPVFILFSLFSQVFADSVYGFDRKAFCSVLKHCLDDQPKDCKDKLTTKNKDIKYDLEFCSIPKEVRVRNIKPTGDLHREVYGHLGKEYRVIYEAKGTLPVNADMMKYLMAHLPFTTQLVNAYQGTNYTIKYMDKKKKRFKGNNGGNLAGDIRFLHQSKDSTSTLFYGYGTAKVLMWSLHGVALVFLEYRPISNNQITYELRSVVFPGNAMLNGIMKMGMFRDVVEEKIAAIVNDVQKSAAQYASGNLKPIQTYPGLKAAWAQTELKEFEQVITKSGYTPLKK
jgi:hypothetical protein